MAGTIIADRIQADTGTGSVQILSNTGTTVATFGGDGQLRFVAGSASVPAIAPAGDLNTGIFFPAADTVAIGTGGTEALRVNRSQNVGIGTTSPGAKLAVIGTSGTLSNAGIRVNSTPGTQSANSGLWLSGNQSTSHYNWLLASQYNVNATFEITPSTAVDGATFSNPVYTVSNAGLHKWFNGTTQAMTLDASGNLAVGTSTTTNARLFSYVNDASLPGLGVRQDGAGAIQVWQGAGGVERARIANDGTFTYKTSTLASYQWTAWNPTNLTGTITTAPSTGTTDDSNYVTMSNSSGTLTVTFDVAGTYLICINCLTQHAAIYTYDTIYANLGGTATRRIGRDDPNNWGDGSNDGNLAITTSFYVSATATQTLTIQPQFRTVGSGTTSQHTAYCNATIQYCGG